jgi:hypothetical protein
MAPRKDVSGAAHVGGQLIHLVVGSVEHALAQRLVTQIAFDELICGRIAELRVLEVDAEHPVPLMLEPPHQMVPIKPPAPHTKAVFLAVIRHTFLLCRSGHPSCPRRS